MKQKENLVLTAEYDSLKNEVENLRFDYEDITEVIQRLQELTEEGQVPIWCGERAVNYLHDRKMLIVADFETATDYLLRMEDLLNMEAEV